MRPGENQKQKPAGVLSGFVPLTNLGIDIDGDGLNAFVTILSKKIGTFRLRVSFGMMSRLQHEVDRAMRAMRFRQSAFNHGADGIDSIKAHGLRPNVTACDITLEGGYVVVLWQFDDAPPLAIRLTVEEAETLSAKWYDLRLTMVN